MLTRAINWPLTAVICVSTYGHKCITALDVLPAARFHVIYNGVDTYRSIVRPDTAIRFRRKYGIPDDRSIVTQVSWMRPEKGVQDLLEAAELVLRVNPNVHFALVGDGPSRDEYIRLAARMGIQDHCTWTGLVQDPFSEGVYAAADVVCQVSRWEEVFGLTIAEAMASGRPVIGTRVGGIPELVDDGETGFLVPRGDVKEMADRILALLADPALRARLGEAGRRKAATRFDLRRNVSQLLGLYGLA
jgi:glycosyltransferase involved in cell wall biosynthesis